MSESKARRKAKKLLKQYEEKHADPDFRWSKTRIQQFERKKAFIITAAINNTPIKPSCWNSMKIYAEECDAEILVIPILYKNPNRRQDEQDGDPGVWWPKEVLPYLVESRLKIHPYLWVMGDARIGATNVNPLAGLDGVSKAASAIYGHPQLQMRTVPTPQETLPKILHTTGSISEKQYSRSSLGFRAKFHHTNAAVVVHKKGKKFHLRSVTMDEDGGFYDLDRYFSEEGVSGPHRAEALVTGDEHAIFICKEVKEATYGGSRVPFEESLVGRLRPKVIIRHDLLDSYAITHHHRGNPITRFAKQRDGMDDMERELLVTMTHLNETTPRGTKNVIVASNHNEHLLRWLKEADWKDELKNARLYLQLMDRVLEEVKIGPGGAVIPDPFAIWARTWGKVKSHTRFLERDESFVVQDIETGFHGDRGPNGARGSPRGYANVGIRVIGAHNHGPCIHQGFWRVGCSCPLRMEYTSGPSGWLNTHAIIHPNGKRQMVHIIEGEW